MGNILFDSNYIDICSNSEREESSMNEINTPKKERYNFYLETDFLINSDLDESIKHIIRQKFAINKINLIIKHVRKFLFRKKTKKKLSKNFSFKMDGTPIINNTNNNNELNIKSKSKTDLFTEDNNINSNEQKNMKLMRKSLIMTSENFNETNDKPILNNIGDAYIIGKISSNKRVKYIKTFFSDGDIYKSYYEKNKALQYGIYNYYKLGTIYEGYWKDDKKTGIGIEIKYDGTLYKGEFDNGKKNGTGIYYWKDNSVYFGEWQDNKCHGYGVFKNGNRSKYQGEFCYNKRNGYGELIKYDIGTFYFGYWSNNKRKGFGVEYSHRNNEKSKIYVGYWNRDHRHGYGMILNKNCKNIYGVWKQNKAKDVFKTKEEFDIKSKDFVDKHLIPFFNKTFEEYEKIFKFMIDSSEFINNYFD